MSPKMNLSGKNNLMGKLEYRYAEKKSQGGMALVDVNDKIARA